MTDRFETLIEQLQSPDPFQRSEAVLQLLPGSGVNDRAIAMLVNIICIDDDLNVVEDATWTLVRYGSVALTALLREVHHPNARARHNIVHALGKLGDTQAVPQLIAATQDTDQSVRMKAVYALGQIGDERAIDAIIAALDDSVQNVQWTAREVLESFGLKALPHLIRALTVESAQVRELAASLLSDLADDSAVEPLVAALETDDWQVRFAIIEALGSIGNSRALPAVQRMTEDANPPVRTIANRVAKQLSRA